MFASKTLRKVRHQLSDPASDHRRIALGFFWVSLFVFTGKLAGAAKEMTIAWRYGVGAQVDAYVLVFNLATWPVAVWFNILSIALVPVLVRTSLSDTTELPRFRGELLGWNVAMAAVLGLATWIALQWIFQANSFGLREDIRREGIAAIGLLAFVAPLGIVSSFLSTLVMARGGHRNTLLEAVPAAVIVAALFAPAGSIPEPLLWGTVIGFALQLGMLAVTAGTRADLPHMRMTLRSPMWRAVGRTVMVMAIGQTIAGFSVIIDQFLAARSGTGAASSLSYATRVMALILTMGAIGISRATLHVFSEIHEKRRHELQGLALRWSALAFGAGLLAAAACMLAAPLIITPLFERGAFTAEDSVVVAHLLRIIAAQLPFYLACTVLMNYLASAEAHRAIALGAGVGLVAKIAFLALPFPWPAIDVVAASATVFTLAWGGTLLVASLQMRTASHARDRGHP